VLQETVFDHLRYVNLIHEQADASGRSAVGPATFFVSHCWNSPWESLVDALMVHAADQVSQGAVEPFYWVDIFAVQQHTGGLDAPAWQSSRSSTERSRAEGGDDLMGDDLTEDKGFKAVCSVTKKTVLHLEPWFAPEAISRVWCLFEIFTTLQVGGEVTVCLATKDARNFAATKAEGDGDVEALLEKAIDKIDARKAAATYAPDWNMNVKLIINAGQLDALNKAVQSQMRRWLTQDTSFDAGEWEQQGRQA